jgi:hypothetical protein
LNKLPRDADKKLVSWNFDSLPTIAGIDWTKKNVMVLTLKAWLTKLRVLEFNLKEDAFDGNLLWC